MFSNLNFDQSDCCVFDISHYCKMDQAKFFLTKQCEIDFNSQVFGTDLNQNVSLLPEVPKCQESDNSANSDFIHESQGVQSSSRMLEMLKQHCLTMSKFIFHIEPLLLHFEVKSHLSKLIFATN